MLGSCLLLLWACRPAVQPKPGISTAPPAPPRTYPARGVVKELKPDGQTVVIQHEAIPGYMEAMTMPFPVKDPKELAGLHPGDRVEFRLVVTTNEGWIDQIKPVAATAPTPPTAPPARPEWRVVRAVEPLKVGDVMPDYRFTNQLGQVVSLSEFRG
ncbi:MAG: copper-binding protein, partial [Verrucomicrobia bacterium]|nr:copper-binding protein [Verrucomicrobiota bacterium]